VKKSDFLEMYVLIAWMTMNIVLRKISNPYDAIILDGQLYFLSLSFILMNLRVKLRLQEQLDLFLSKFQIMDIVDLRAFCLGLSNVTEDTPFDADVLAFRVHGKIFALASMAKNDSVNLKCDPERAVQLREQFAAVQPGYHMNKTHWNTVFFNQDLNDLDLLDLVKHSYDLIFASLPKKIRES
jgi:predicted DNA-binding protein (MmcQ/YjbR family)